MSMILSYNNEYHLAYPRLYVRCVLSKWDYFVKKENLILGLKIKTRTNKEEQKLI